MRSLKKIIYSIAFIGLFSLPILAQKTVNIQLKPGDHPGEYLGEAMSAGTTIFTVKLKRGQTFEAAADIRSNNSKMMGLMYVKDSTGTVGEGMSAIGTGAHHNEFDGTADKTEIWYFKITERPGSKFRFGILVRDPGVKK